MAAVKGTGSAQQGKEGGKILKIWALSDWRGSGVGGGQAVTSARRESAYIDFRTYWRCCRSGQSVHLQAGCGQVDETLRKAHTAAGTLSKVGLPAEHRTLTQAELSQPKRLATLIVKKALDGLRTDQKPRVQTSAQPSFFCIHTAMKHPFYWPEGSFAPLRFANIRDDPAQLSPLPSLTHPRSQQHRIEAVDPLPARTEKGLAPERSCTAVLARAASLYGRLPSRTQ